MESFEQTTSLSEEPSKRSTRRIESEKRSLVVKAKCLTSESRVAVKNITWNDALLTFIWLDNEWCSTYTWHPHWMKFWDKCNHKHPCFIWHFTFQRWPAWTNQICLKLDVDTKYHPWSFQCSDTNFLLDRNAMIKFTSALINLRGDHVHRCLPAQWVVAMFHDLSIIYNNHTSCRFVCYPVTCNFLPVA